MPRNTTQWSSSVSSDVRWGAWTVGYEGSSVRPLPPLFGHCLATSSLLAVSSTTRYSSGHGSIPSTDLWNCLTSESRDSIVIVSYSVRPLACKEHLSMRPLSIVPTVLILLAMALQESLFAKLPMCVSPGEPVCKTTYVWLIRRACLQNCLCVAHQESLFAKLPMGPLGCWEVVEASSCNQCVLPCVCLVLPPPPSRLSAVILYEQMFGDSYLHTVQSRQCIGQACRSALVTPLIETLTSPGETLLY